MGCLTLDERSQLRSSPSSHSVPLGRTGVLTEALLFTAHGVLWAFAFCNGQPDVTALETCLIRRQVSELPFKSFQKRNRKNRGPEIDRKPRQTPCRSSLGHAGWIPTGHWGELVLLKLFPPVFGRMNLVPYPTQTLSRSSLTLPHQSLPPEFPLFVLGIPMVPGIVGA